MILLGELFNSRIKLSLEGVPLILHFLDCLSQLQWLHVLEIIHGAFFTKESLILTYPRLALKQRFNLLTCDFCSLIGRLKNLLSLVQFLVVFFEVSLTELLGSGKLLYLVLDLFVLLKLSLLIFFLLLQ